MRAGMSAILVATLLSNVVGSSPAIAQPSTAQPSAKELYEAAEAAMAAKRFADAARDYQRAYDSSRQPALLFKIARAHQEAGDCASALTYYGRYLREGQPAENFVATTRQRIVECKGDPDALAAAPAAPAEPAPKPDEPAKPAPPSPPEVVVETKPAPEPVAPPAPPPQLGKDRAAWLLVGGSVAMLTIGGVLAYSANAAEADVNDLYVGLGNRTPRYDDRTRERYDELIAEGERYELLSRISLGVAGGLGIAAAVMFLRGDRDAETTKSSRIVPVVSPRNTGVLVRF